jgi:hypothetical protein
MPVSGSLRHTLGAALLALGFAYVAGGCGDERPTTVIERERTVSIERSRRPADPRPRTVTVERPSPGPSRPGTWPVDRAGYTVIIASTASRAAAEAQARRATDRGWAAGVLYSSDFSTLRPGYWVAFTGYYRTAREARSAAGDVRSAGYGDAYARYVSR